MIVHIQEQTYHLYSRVTASLVYMSPLHVCFFFLLPPIPLHPLQKHAMQAMRHAAATTARRARERIATNTSKYGHANASLEPLRNGNNSYKMRYVQEKTHKSHTIRN